MSTYRRIALSTVAALAVALGTTAALAIPTPHAAPVAHDSLPATVDAPRQIPSAGSAPIVKPALPAAVHRVAVAIPKPVARPVVQHAVAVAPKPASAPARPAAKPADPVFLAPVWHQASCSNADASGAVDIPSSPGVVYDLDTIPGKAGRYTVGAGVHTVTALARSASKSWTFTAADMSVQCGIPAPDTTPNASDIPPVWHQDTCTVDLPTVPGVTYALDTIPSAPGNGYQIDAGVHTVTASTNGSARMPTWTVAITAPC